MPIPFALLPDVRDLGDQFLVEFRVLLDQRQRLFLLILKHRTDQRRHSRIIAAKQTIGHVGRLAAWGLVLGPDALDLADDTPRESLRQPDIVQRGHPILTQG